MKINLIELNRKQRDQQILQQNNVCMLRTVYQPKENQNKGIKSLPIWINRQFSLNLPLKDQQETSERCKICSVTNNKLQILKNEIGYLKQRNQQFKEEIQLLSQNFSYIIELVAENIVKGLKSRVGMILKEKDNIIEKQLKTIKNLQSQSDILVEKIDLNMEIEMNVQKMHQKIKALELENKTLKQFNKRYLSQSCQPNCQCFIEKKEVKTIQSQSPGEILECFGFNQIDIDQRNGLFIPKSIFRLEKRNTLQISKQRLSQQQTLKIKSLNKLKSKICLIREKLTNQAIK